MVTTAPTLLLTDLNSAEVRAYLEQDGRLIVPLGACDQYGEHLPIGAATLVAEAFATQLSQDFGVLRSPTLPFGVNVPVGCSYPGVATVREKSLHAFLNDLLASWEDCGFREFILITVHDYDSHVQAVATVTGTTARVRVIEVLNMDLSQILTGGKVPEHGGEALTSLMLFLYPGKVRMDRALDYLSPERSASTLRRVPHIPLDAPGSLGRPSVATAETGKRLFEHICEKIRTRVFTAPE